MSLLVVVNLYILGICLQCPEKVHSSHHAKRFSDKTSIPSSVYDSRQAS